MSIDGECSNDGVRNRKGGVRKEYRKGRVRKEYRRSNDGVRNGVGA